MCAAPVLVQQTICGGKKTAGEICHVNVGQTQQKMIRYELGRDCWYRSVLENPSKSITSLSFVWLTHSNEIFFSVTRLLFRVSKLWNLEVLMSQSRAVVSISLFLCASHWKREVETLPIPAELKGQFIPVRLNVAKLSVATETTCFVSSKLNFLHILLQPCYGTLPAPPSSEWFVRSNHWLETQVIHIFADFDEIHFTLTSCSLSFHDVWSGRGRAGHSVRDLDVGLRTTETTPGRCEALWWATFVKASWLQSGSI